MGEKASKLSRSNLLRLQFAEGWLGLNSPSEASKELLGLDVAVEQHPDVLALKWSICASKEDWTEAFRLATQHLAVRESDLRAWINHSYALRRMPGGGIQKAHDALFPALDRFPKDVLVPYNLACYQCRLGNSETAIALLKRALKNGSRSAILAMAKEDPDLILIRKTVMKLR